MASSIDTHPQRNQIVEGLLSGRSYREIGESVTPRVSAMALHRYKAKRIGPTLDGAGVLSKALQTLAQANGQDAVTLDPKAVTQAALAADPLLARIASHQGITDRELQRVTSGSKPDPRGTAALISADLKGLELHARLTGRLDSTPKVVNQIAFVTVPGGITGTGQRLDDMPMDTAIECTAEVIEE